MVVQKEGKCEKREFRDKKETEKGGVGEYHFEGGVDVEGSRGGKL